ncbi:unnamed protein product [Caenorhabditis nigoni]
MNENLQLEEDVANQQVVFDKETDWTPQINEEHIVNDFIEVAEQQHGQINEIMSLSAHPVNFEMEIPVKQEFLEDEENDNQLIVFDVIQEDAPQDTDGYVSIVRIQTAWDDLHQYIGDLIRFPDASHGFLRQCENGSDDQ